MFFMFLCCYCNKLLVDSNNFCKSSTGAISPQSTISKGSRAPKPSILYAYALIYSDTQIKSILAFSLSLRFESTHKYALNETPEWVINIIVGRHRNFSLFHPVHLE